MWFKSYRWEYHTCKKKFKRLLLTYDYYFWQTGDGTCKSYTTNEIHVVTLRRALVFSDVFKRNTHPRVTYRRGFFLIARYKNEQINLLNNGFPEVLLYEHCHCYNYYYYYHCWHCHLKTGKLKERNVSVDKLYQRDRWEIHYNRIFVYIGPLTHASPVNVKKTKNDDWHEGDILNICDWEQMCLLKKW